MFRSPRTDNAAVIDGSEYVLDQAIEGGKQDEHATTDIDSHWSDCHLRDDSFSAYVCNWQFTYVCRLSPHLGICICHDQLLHNRYETTCIPGSWGSRLNRCACSDGWRSQAESIKISISACLATNLRRSTGRLDVTNMPLLVCADFAFAGDPIHLEPLAAHAKLDRFRRE